LPTVIRALPCVSPLARVVDCCCFVVRDREAPSITVACVWATTGLHCCVASCRLQLCSISRFPPLALWCPPGCALCLLGRARRALRERVRQLQGNNDDLLATVEVLKCGVARSRVVAQLSGLCCCCSGR
jgi:hypothetical protein